MVECFWSSWMMVDCPKENEKKFSEKEVGEIKSILKNLLEEVQKHLDNEMMLNRFINKISSMPVIIVDNYDPHFMKWKAHVIYIITIMRNNFTDKDQLERLNDFVKSELYFLEGE